MITESKVFTHDEQIVFELSLTQEGTEVVTECCPRTDLDLDSDIERCMEMFKYKYDCRVYC